MDYSVLETLIKRVQRDPKELDLFYWALPRLDLLVLGRVAGGGREGLNRRTLQKGQELELYFFENEKGRRMLPVYTSEAMLRLGLGREQDNLQVSARLLLRMLEPTDSLIFNANTDCSLELGSREIQSLLKGQLGRSFRGTSRFLLGPPQATPWLVLRSLKEYFRTCPMVEAAYLGERLEEDKTGLSQALEVGVVMKKGQEEEFLAQLVPELRALATRFKEPRLAFCLVTGHVRSEYRALKITPFYRQGLVRQVRKIRVYVPERFEKKA